MRGGCCCLAIVIVAGAAVVSLAQAPVRASGPAALGAAQAPAPAPAQAVALQVGDAAPDFALPGSDGQTYRLADYRGVKPVVLAWFPKGPIREWLIECLPPREGGDDWRAFDVEFFEVGVDSEDNHQRLAELAHLRHPILTDASRAVAERYGVLTTNRRNVRRVTFYIGTDGRILDIDRAPIADGHGEGVAERLAALGIARRR